MGIFTQEYSGDHRGIEKRDSQKPAPGELVCQCGLILTIKTSQAGATTENENMTRSKMMAEHHFWQKKKKKKRRRMDLAYWLIPGSTPWRRGLFS
jgi:hypothetical protein